MYLINIFSQDQGVVAWCDVAVPGRPSNLADSRARALKSPTMHALNTKHAVCPITFIY